MELASAHAQLWNRLEAFRTGGRLGFELHVVGASRASCSVWTNRSALRSPCFLVTISVLFRRFGETSALVRKNG